MTNIAKNEELRAALRKLVSEWQPNSSVPPDYIREDGMGQRIAIVDVRCGGYQWAHTPTVVGWEVQHGSRVASGLVQVHNPHNPDSVQDAIFEAKSEADDAYFKIFGVEPPLSDGSSASDDGDPFSLEGIDANAY